MVKSVFTLLVCCAAWSVSVAQSDGDAATGRVLAEKSCAYCHGPDGNGNKSFPAFQRGIVPRIAAQPQPYLIKSMGEYKQGMRPDDDMSVVAEQLSDEDIRNLAAWYATQPPSATATYEDSVWQ